MRRTNILAAFAAVTLALAPAMADAAAGRGSSQGSRGSRTDSAPPTTATAPTTAAPMQRSTTQPGPSGAAAAAPSRGGMFGGGIMGGLMGGLIGAGLVGMLFGGGMMGGLGGIASIFGLLLQVGLVVLVVTFAVRWFRSRRQPAMAGGPDMMARTNPQDQNMMGRTAMGGMGGGAAAAPVTIQPEDFQAFERLLQDVQAAWTAGNEGALRAFTTPEMASYFGEQLSDMARAGQRSQVTDVKLEQGDLAEAWAENGQEYATVAMRFSAMDATLDATGRVVEGNATTRSMLTEIWTFVRRPGDRWVLSAIQQTR